MAYTISVQREWFECMTKMHPDECPFCGSNKITTTPGDETFLPRRGCRNCAKWIDEVRFKEK